MDIVVRPLPITSSVILAWVALFLLYLLLKRFLHEPVTKMLNERKESIQSDIDGAKALQEDAKILKEDYESRIDLAKKESQEIIEGARRRGEELREGIISDARKESESIIANARREISRERDAALQEIQKQAGEIGVLIASKIMEEEVSMDKQKILIDKFIDEVGSSKWQN